MRFNIRPRISAAIFCLFLVSGAFLHAQGATATPCLKKGTERWPIKTSLPENAKKVAMTLADALKIVPLPKVAKDDPAYQDKRIGPEQPVQENQIVTISGWLYLVALESDDCDFHIQISPQPRTKSNPPTPDDNCMIVEVPAGQYAANTELGKTLDTTRQWVVDNLLAHQWPKMDSVNVMQHPVFVTVTGALFYDDAHTYEANGGTGRGKAHMQSKTLWELHPVTSIKFATKPAN